MVSPLDADAISGAINGHADAIVVDLASRTPPIHREESRSRVTTALRDLTARGAELLLWTDAAGIEADLEACAPGSFGGVVVASDDDLAIQTVDKILSAWEAAHGVPAGTLNIELVIATGKAVQNVERLAVSSSRVVALALDDAMLLEEMGAAPSGHEDRLLYHRGRVSIAAASVRLQAHALGYANGTVEDRAVAGREGGLRGAFCFYSYEVAACNVGFSPPDDEVDAARLILDSMNSSIEDGKGAVAVSQGHMADLANIRGAQATIAWSDAVKEREGSIIGAS